MPGPLFIPLSSLPLLRRSSLVLLITPVSAPRIVEGKRFRRTESLSTADPSRATTVAVPTPKFSRSRVTTRSSSAVACGARSAVLAFSLFVGCPVGCFLSTLSTSRRPTPVSVLLAPPVDSRAGAPETSRSRSNTRTSPFGATVLPRERLSGPAKSSVGCAAVSIPSDPVLGTPTLTSPIEGSLPARRVLSRRGKRSVRSPAQCLSPSLSTTSCVRTVLGRLSTRSPLFGVYSLTFHGLLIGPMGLEGGYPLSRRPLVLPKSVSVVSVEVPSFPPKSPVSIRDDTVRSMVRPTSARRTC